jgi:aldose 1-epimerase
MDAAPFDPTSAPTRMLRQTIISGLMMTVLLLAGCAPEGDRASTEPAVTSEPFGESDGERVDLYTLRNGHGMEMRVTNYGGIITHLYVPDRDGEFADVVLGYDSLAPYVDRSPYFGAIIGRYGNRIGGARFDLDGETYVLEANDGPNHLHGGEMGFDKVVWAAETLEQAGRRSIRLTYTSQNGEEGYPGMLEARVTYTLTDADELVVDYQATVDKPTPVNLTQHTYFNLGGIGSGDILDHEITIHADRFTPVDSTLIPTGELRPVAGTPFDFTEPASIGARIGAENEQIDFGGGYDHNFVLNGDVGALKAAARVAEPTSGRVMDVHTTEPGVQFYTGNFLDGSMTGKGVSYTHRTGFCLETQHFPDSPNKESFPPTILRPGETYASRTIYAFSVSPGE